MFHRRLPALTLTALAFSVVAHAQSSQTSGAVRGAVRDRAGRAVAGASIRVQNQETGVSRSTRSGATGEFSFPLLPLSLIHI